MTSRVGLLGDSESGRERRGWLKAALIPILPLFPAPRGKHFTERRRNEGERAMKPAIKLLLRRSLMTLGAILVWAKALAGGKTEEQTQSTPETDQKTAGGRQQEPNRKP